MPAARQFGQTGRGNVADTFHGPLDCREIGLEAKQQSGNWSGDEW